jgi:GH24 family phage-related lysozyme (muramidase)
MKIAAYHPETNQYLGEVNLVYNEKGDPKVYPFWLKTRLENFKGDLAWIHDREGHAGKPYWPGGISGVTLDPGVDLGYADFEQVRQWYKDVLSSEQLKRLEPLTTIHGETAKLHAINLSDIRISEEQAVSIMPHSLKPYWDGIRSRFPLLNHAPAAVQTALLSIAYNRGAMNPGLEPLRLPIAQKDWRTVGKLIMGMQQDHHLAGIRARRRLEGQYILERL